MFVYGSVVKLEEVSKLVAKRSRGRDKIKWTKMACAALDL